MRQQEPLRTVSDDERAVLEHLSRSAREQAAVVARAKAVLAVAEGASYTAAAQGSLQGHQGPGGGPIALLLWLASSLIEDPLALGTRIDRLAPATMPWDQGV